jgi:hypothetical protein
MSKSRVQSTYPMSESFSVVRKLSRCNVQFRTRGKALDYPSDQANVSKYEPPTCMVSTNASGKRWHFQNRRLHHALET